VGPVTWPGTATRPIPSTSGAFARARRHGSPVAIASAIHCTVLTTPPWPS